MTAKRMRRVRYLLASLFILVLITIPFGAHAAHLEFCTGRADKPGLCVEVWPCPGTAYTNDHLTGCLTK